MRIGIVDADLIGTINHRFPNLCAMKISGYHKNLGDVVDLITDWGAVNKYDRVYISKVFTATEVPDAVLALSNVVYGGTGFYYDMAPGLPSEIEHHMPDYHLYDTWVDSMVNKGFKRDTFIYYTDCSIGYLTRHCFMGCAFCVNRNYREVLFNAHVSEFLDKTRKLIILLDDQFLGFDGWELLLDELIATRKPFQFKQGLDIRFMTPKKAQKLTSAKYYKDFIFAFDKLDDAALIGKKLTLWRQYTNKRTKLYTFCGYEKDKQYTEHFWIDDINSLFKRIFILAEYDCVAYVMRHQDYELSPFTALYKEIAAWCNQPWALRTMTFRQFCIGRGMGRNYKRYKHDPIAYLKDDHKKGSQWVTMEWFEKLHPEIAKTYFDKKYSDGAKKTTNKAAIK